MTRQFDFNSIASVGFGVCIDGDQGEEFYLIPSNNNVQAALKDMLSETVGHFMDSGRLKADKYEAAEKYASMEILQIALDDNINAKLRELYAATNIPSNPGCMGDPNLLIYYFATFYDKNGSKVVAVRRAQYFRGIAKQGNMLVRIIDDSLDLIDDNVFKLDRDFDYFICDNTVFILRPSGFEFTAGIDDYILERGAENARDLGKTLSILDTSGLSEYVKTHKRAARLLAAIRSRNDIKKTSPAKLKKACKENGIELVVKKGLIAPAEGHEMGFLQMLDRRRYTLSLTDDGDELYEATGRKNVT